MTNHLPHPVGIETLTLGNQYEMHRGVIGEVENTRHRIRLRMGTADAGMGSWESGKIPDVVLTQAEALALRDALNAALRDLDAPDGS